MRLLPAVVVAAALLAALAAPASARVTQPQGDPCRLYAVSDTTVATAGPLRVVDEDAPDVLHTATVTCTLQTGSVTHAGGTPVWSLSSAPSLAVVALPPDEAGPVDWFTVPALCTRLDLDGGATTLYLNVPYDRNETPTWSTDPAARCDDLVETLDLRLGEDPPGRYAFQALATAGGEADGARGPAGPGLGEPSTISTISVVRAAGGVAVLRTAPYGWTCTDTRTGLVVGVGSPLATPDPAVSCTAPGLRCERVEASGVLAPANLGRVTVTSGCAPLSVSRQLTPAQGDVVGTWSTQYRGEGTLPLTCAVTEDAAVEPSYEAVCGVYAI